MQPPVILFAFNRADTLAAVLDGLHQQTVMPPRLIAYVDGPRHDADRTKVAAVLALLRAVDWTPVEIHERPTNYGGPRNLFEGISEVLAQAPAAIILEDDTVPASHFYQAMARMLTHYASEPRIFSVSGFPFLLPDALPEHPYDAIVSPRFCVWGWGTWADRWDSVAADLADFRSPYRTPLAVPRHAGMNLPRQAIHAHLHRGGVFFIGIALALLTLHRDQWHVLSRHRLIQNIGMMGGMTGQRSQSEIDLFQKSLSLEDVLPVTLPPVSLRADVLRAIQAFIREVESYRPWRRRLRPWWRYLRNGVQGKLHALRRRFQGN